MKTKIIYHEVKPGVACPDGYAAAYVAILAHPEAQIRGWTYQSDALPEVERGDRLIIVDFSFKGDVIENWIREGVEVVVLDHHKTAEQELSRFLTGNFTQFLERDSWEQIGDKKEGEGLNPTSNLDYQLNTQKNPPLLSKPSLADIRFDLNECGATMAWKYFFPDKPMPVFLEYVRDRDLWNFELPKSEEIHEAIAGMRRTFALFDMLSLMSQDELLKFIAPIGEKLLAPKREAIASVASRHQWEDVAGHTVPVVRLKEDGSEDRLTSDVCMVLYRQYPDTPFSACITSDGTYSLRSDKHGNNTDVGAIAVSMGGGGHRNASGYKLMLN